MRAPWWINCLGHRRLSTADCLVRELLAPSCGKRWYARWRCACLVATSVARPPYDGVVLPYPPASGIRFVTSSNVAARDDAAASNPHHHTYGSQCWIEAGAVSRRRKGEQHQERWCELNRPFRYVAVITSFSADARHGILVSIYPTERRPLCYVLIRRFTNASAWSV